MKSRLINRLKSKLYRYFDEYISSSGNRHLFTILQYPNTLIANDVINGVHSQFVFHGSIGLLKVEEGVVIRKFCNFLLHENAKLIIHRNVFFNNYCSVNCLGHIEIGENTIMGEGVKIYDHNHLYNYNLNGELIVERDRFKIGVIKIGKNCWIGSNVTILNNVEVGDNVIIGANCLIYKSIPSNSIVKHKEELIVISKDECVKDE